MERVPQRRGLFLCASVTRDCLLVGSWRVLQDFRVVTEQNHVRRFTSMILATAAAVVASDPVSHAGRNYDLTGPAVSAEDWRNG